MERGVYMLIDDMLLETLGNVYAHELCPEMPFEEFLDKYFDNALTVNEKRLITTMYATQRLENILEDIHKKN